MTSKLYTYAIFHGNLNFSYIPKDLYPQILHRCYWPLLRIAEEERIPLGFEMSAYTLEVVNSLDPSFTRRLAGLWADGGCEFIGSGYVQAIMPLIPARVNRENLRHGNQVYQELLGRRPTMAFVNEQVYSAGLPRLYREAEYESLVVNWDSALPAHDHPELVYRPCAVAVGDDSRMPVIWHYTGAYREFQRYIEAETTLDEYLAWLQSHIPETGRRALALYSSDWEVFDFKPWEPYPDGFPGPERGEMVRVAELLSLLRRRKEIEFVSPGSLLQLFPDPPLVQPESSDNPLPYKKQHLHPMCRWAVGGRDGVRLNTQCYYLYQRLFQAERYVQRHPEPTTLGPELSNLWKELCFLWNSDFRTFTTEEKYLEFRNRMGAAQARTEVLLERLQPPKAAPGRLWLANYSSAPAGAEPVSFTIPANGGGSGRQPAYELQLDGQTVPCQVTRSVPLREDARTLTLEAIPPLTTTGDEVGVIREVAGPASTSPASARSSSTGPSSRGNGAYRIDARKHIVETPSARLELLPQYGGGIEALSFPGVSSEPLISLDHRDLARGDGPDDYPIPGDLTLRDWRDRTVTDHQATELQYPEPDAGCEIFVPVRCYIPTPLGAIWKTYRVYLRQSRVDLIMRFQWRDAVPTRFRLGRMSLNPRAFDRSALYYATTQGGEDIERFPLAGQDVRQDEPLAPGLTARGCLGATEGWVVLGDGTRGLGFITRPGSLYSAPMIHYEEPVGSQSPYRLSLVYSLGEQDETSHILWRGHSAWRLSILAGNDEIIAEARASGLLSNGGLVARSEIGSDQPSAL